MARPTLNDIAREIGFSKNAISLALRESPQIPPATRQKIREAAERLGYQPNPVVSQLMAQLRSTRTLRLQAKLALVNANRDQAAFRQHPTVPTYVEGCESRAAKLGYAFDHFWLHEPTANADQWIRVFRTRGIKGIVLVGLMDTNHLPAHLEPVWKQFPSVVTGVRTREPALSFCCVDHHHLALTAFERAIALGYSRPGLVIDDVIEAMIERRFSAGYFAGQSLLPTKDQIPVFGDVAGNRPADNFRIWLERYKPDVIFTLYNNAVTWLKALGLKIPDDIGVIQLEWRAARPEIAGMNQHSRVIGEAAVDMVVTQIHNNETGIQEFPRATLIGATWVDGPSVKNKNPLPAAEEVKVTAPKKRDYAEPEKSAKLAAPSPEKRRLKAV